MTIILVGILSKFIDKIDSIILIPLTLILRGLSFFAIFLCEDPNSWTFKIMGPLSHTGFHFTFIAFNSFF